ncbi:MAG TPA: hypothetical protein PLN31_17850 [Azoarcus taiwanensis]|nr:hypothetical protein [Azoarcus taiwanensis]
MNVRSDKKIEETDQYDDAVLEAGGLPPVELPAAKDDSAESSDPNQTKLEADAFLEAFYRNQE